MAASRGWRQNAKWWCTCDPAGFTAPGVYMGGWSDDAVTASVPDGGVTWDGRPVLERGVVKDGIEDDENVDKEVDIDRALGVRRGAVV